jgi:hypothetical protein
MRFTSILPAVFATAIMAAPTAVEIRGDEVCAPVSYTISDFILQISPSTGTANFNMKSFFSVGNLEDEVQWGVHCRGAGSSVPNSNECKAEKRHLLFDLRGPQEQAYYQITHTWYCNGYVFPIFACLSQSLLLVSCSDIASGFIPLLHYEHLLTTSTAAPGCLAPLSRSRTSTAATTEARTSAPAVPSRSLLRTCARSAPPPLARWLRLSARLPGA